MSKTKKMVAYTPEAIDQVVKIISKAPAEIVYGGIKTLLESGQQIDVTFEDPVKDEEVITPEEVK